MSTTELAMPMVMEATKPAGKIEAPKARVTVAEAALKAKEKAAEKRSGWLDKVRGLVEKADNMMLMGIAVTHKESRNMMLDAVGDLVNEKADKLVAAGRERLNQVDKAIGDAGERAMGAIGKGVDSAVDAGRKFYKDTTRRVEGGINKIDKAISDTVEAGKRETTAMAREAVLMTVEVVTPAVAEVGSTVLEAMKMANEVIADARAIPREIIGAQGKLAGGFVMENIANYDTFLGALKTAESLKGKKLDIFQSADLKLAEVKMWCFKKGLELFLGGKEYRKAAREIRSYYQADSDEITAAQAGLDKAAAQAKNRTLI